MATLSIINNFSLDSNGRTKTGKQGASTDDFDTAYEGLAVAGTCHYVEGSLATASFALVWDNTASTGDVPTTWDYLYFWADQTVDIQLMTSATNVILRNVAKCPFVMSLAAAVGLLAAANTTAITGSAATLTALAKVYIGNYSGTTVNYLLAVID